MATEVEVECLGCNKLVPQSSMRLVDGYGVEACPKCAGAAEYAEMVRIKEEERRHQQVVSAALDNLD